MKTTMDKNELRMMRRFNVILNRYQDIEDILDDDTLTEKQKLSKIRKVNEKIGKEVMKELPE